MLSEGDDVHGGGLQTKTAQQGQPKLVANVCMRSRQIGCVAVDTEAVAVAEAVEQILVVHSYKTTVADEVKTALSEQLRAACEKSPTSLGRVVVENLRIVCRFFGSEPGTEKKSVLLDGVCKLLKLSESAFSSHLRR